MHSLVAFSEKCHIQSDFETKKADIASWKHTPLKQLSNPDNAALRLVETGLLR